MNDPLISIIVPVYNVENFLRKCLDSIIAQSTDKSGTICDEYAAIDLRFNVFHKENGGVSFARNLGIKEAKGKWITFVDADDIIMERYLSNLLEPVNKYNEVEFVVGGYKNMNRTNGQILSTTSMKEFFSVDPINDFFSQPQLYSSYLFFPYSKLYKTDFVRNNRLSFDENISLGEDRMFVLQYLNQVHNIVFSPSRDYCIMFDNRGNSLSTKKRSRQDYFDNFQRGYQALCSFYQDHPLENIKKYSDNFIADRIFTYIVIPFSKFNVEKHVNAFLVDVIAPFLCSINIQYRNIRNLKIRILSLLLLYGNKHLVFFICKIRNHINSIF